MSVNRVTLLGNVGKTPEIRDGAGGAKFATFSLATTDRGYTKRDGTQVPERTEWHNIVANGSIVQVIERYVTAGTKLYIEGKLRTRKYTARDNTEKYVTEIYLDNMELLGGKPQEQNEDSYKAAVAQIFPEKKDNPQMFDSSSDDDGLPF